MKWVEAFDLEHAFPIRKGAINSAIWMLCSFFLLFKA